VEEIACCDFWGKMAEILSKFLQFLSEKYPINATVKAKKKCGACRNAFIFFLLLLFFFTLILKNRLLTGTNDILNWEKSAKSLACATFLWPTTGTTKLRHFSWDWATDLVWMGLRAWTRFRRSIQIWPLFVRFWQFQRYAAFFEARFKILLSIITGSFTDLNYSVFLTAHKIFLEFP